MQILNHFQIDRNWPFAMRSQAASPQSWAKCDITNDTQAISIYIVDIIKPNQQSNVAFMSHCP